MERSTFTIISPGDLLNPDEDKISHKSLTGVAPHFIPDVDGSGHLQSSSSRLTFIMVSAYNN